MIILCDTCSVLMLIRIAPDMFTDERFGCATIPKVHEEIYRTQKFKTKYSWREEYREQFKTLGTSVSQSEEVKLQLETIKVLVDAGVENQDTGNLVDLSLTDMHVVACASAYGHGISSVDRNLVYFAQNEFELQNISPLGLVNMWIQNGLISWDERLQILMEDWEKNGEAEQPLEEVGRFQQLTGFRYVGS